MSKLRITAAVGILGSLLLPITGDAADLGNDPHAMPTATEAARGAVPRVLSVTGADFVVGGNEFAVASGFVGPAVPDPWPAVGGGTHFHSDDNLTFPAVTTDDLEIGNFPSFSSEEEARGMVEFDLAGLPTAVEVAVTCMVGNLGGLYGQGFSVFDIEVSAYDGNNSEDIPDFSITTTSVLGTFSTGGLAVGDMVSFDATGAYNAALAAAVPALGVRMEAVTNPGLGAITFEQCELLVTEENIEIDIKPGSDPNSINLGSNGVIPVAILGSDAFDVTSVDVGTLAFGPGGAMPKHKAGGHFADVNGDEYLDLVSHYRTQEVGLAPSDTEACVTGQTLGGMPLRGCDFVRIVP